MRLLVVINNHKWEYHLDLKQLMESTIMLLTKILNYPNFKFIPKSNYKLP
jgi:hypothetical protein